MGEGNREIVIYRTSAGDDMPVKTDGETPLSRFLRDKGVTDGKLTYIEIQALIEKKFSMDSVMKRFKEACDDLSLTLGYRADFRFDSHADFRLPVRLRCENKRPAISVCADANTYSYKDKYLLSISFENKGLKDLLIKARNKSGEELPEVK